MSQVDEKIVDVKLSEVDDLARQALLTKKRISEKEEAIEEEKKELRDIEKRLEATLEYFGKDGWDSKYGKVEIRKRTSVKTPKTEEDKRALFAWLEEKGIFWSTTSVNSQTLNALYKAEFEAGNDKIPGIGEPEIYSTVILKPSK